MSFGNERDVEVPLFLAFLDRNEPATLLDVGACGSVQFYAQQARMRVEHYTAVDPLPDEAMLSVSDVYILDDVTHVQGEYDACSCISMLEHVGKDIENLSDVATSQFRVARKVLALAKQCAVFSFPFGVGRVLGEYASIEAPLLRAIEALAHTHGFETKATFFRSETPQAGGWVEVNRDYASAATNGSSAYSICILEAVKR